MPLRAKDPVDRLLAAARAAGFELAIGDVDQDEGTRLVARRVDGGSGRMTEDLQRAIRVERVAVLARLLASVPLLGAGSVPQALEAWLQEQQGAQPPCTLGDVWPPESLAVWAQTGRAITRLYPLVRDRVRVGDAGNAGLLVAARGGYAEVLLDRDVAEYEERRGGREGRGTRSSNTDSAAEALAEATGRVSASAGGAVGEDGVFEDEDAALLPTEDNEPEPGRARTKASKKPKSKDDFPPVRGFAYREVWPLGGSETPSKIPSNEKLWTPGSGGGIR